jgi:hypothetical protein
MNASYMDDDRPAGQVRGHRPRELWRTPVGKQILKLQVLFSKAEHSREISRGLCRFETNPQLCATLTTQELITRLA